MQMFIKVLQDHTMTCTYQFQRGVYFTGIKVFNSLPVEIKETSYDICSFKNALKSFLLENSFYSLEEYFNWKMNLYDTHK